MTSVVLVIGQSNALRLFDAGSLQNVLAENDSSAVVLGSAEGGTPLAESFSRNDWYPFEDGDPETGELYQQMLADVAALQATDPTAVVTNIVWVQGERDTMLLETAQAYEANLAELVSRLADDFGATTPLTIVQLADQMPEGAGRGERQTLVIDAQAKVAADNDHISLIDPDDVIAAAGLAFEDAISDVVHYNLTGFDLLAEAIVAQDSFAPLIGTGSGSGTGSALGDLGFGAAANDAATGTGFILFAQDPDGRFDQTTLRNAEKFYVVTYDASAGVWRYDTNSLQQAIFTPNDSDVLVAEVDFGADRVTLLEGVNDRFEGIQQGYESGDLRITANLWVDVLTPVEVDTGAFGRGVAGQEDATGEGFILYAREPGARFDAAHPFNAENFFAVRFDAATGDWFYDDNVSNRPFQPVAGDALVARVDFTNNTVQMLEGQNAVFEGIQLGYASGDISIRADFWNGGSNENEFGITGSTLALNPYAATTGATVTVAAGDLGRGIAVQEDATGEAFVLHTTAPGTRFDDAHPFNAQSFYLVKFDAASGQWSYDSNQADVAFTPNANDTLVARIDLGTDKVEMLAGRNGVFEGVQYGYVSGDVSITPNEWNGEFNAGELGLSGTSLILHSDSAATRSITDGIGEFGIEVSTLNLHTDAPEDNAPEDNGPDDNGPDDGTPDNTEAWTFLSFPDMFNADYGDLSGGLDPDIAQYFSDGYADTLVQAKGWASGITQVNSMNENLAAVWTENIQQIAASAGGDVDTVLIAGDSYYARFPRLFDGSISSSEAVLKQQFEALFHDGTPIDASTAAGKAELHTALQHAQEVYGSWMKTLWAEVGVDTVMVALGDHEIGDNPWNLNSRTIDTVPAMKEGFGATYVDPLGLPATYQGISSRAPEGEGQYDETAYAMQKNNVLFITVDMFQWDGTDLGNNESVIASFTQQQLNWVSSLLDAAEADSSVDHVVVQGHTPVLGPVNTIRSSALSLDDGENSDFWQLLETHGTNNGGKVRMYLAGEVHATTVIEDEDSGIVQISHGATTAGDGFGQYDPYWLTFEVFEDKIVAKEFTIINNITEDTSVWEGHRGTSLVVDEVIGGYTQVGTLELNVSDGATDLSVTGNLEAPLRTTGYHNYVGGPGDDVHTTLFNDGITTTANYMYGYGGNDWLDASGGNDRIFGGDGDDTLFGSSGNDTLFGGSGDDRLVGGTGADRLTGGAGADAFVFSTGHGSDTITDFQAGIDTLEIDGTLGLGGAQAVQTSGSNVVITYGNGQKITLQGVDLEDFAPSAQSSFQAEDQILTGSGITVQSNHAGAQGGDYVDFVTAANEAIAFDISAVADGTTTLSIRYALGNGQRDMNLEINGVVVSEVSFTSTGSWNAWDTVDLDVDLLQGDNTVRLVSSGDSGPNVDSFTFVDDVTVIDAADARFSILDGNDGTLLRIEDDPSTYPAGGSGLLGGYSGVGYLDASGGAEDKFALDFEADFAGEHTFVFRLTNGVLAQARAVTVSSENDSATISDTRTGAWGNWQEFDLTLNLQAGQNIITIAQDSAFGAPNIDAVAIFDGPQVLGGDVFDML